MCNSMRGQHVHIFKDQNTHSSEEPKNALFAHRSQDGENIFNRHHDIMARFRGREIGVAAAEAFATLARDNRTGRLPGMS